jgi:hypothetical protein
MSLHPTVETDGELTTITFTDGKSRQDQNAIAAELEGFTPVPGEHLVLDCRNLSRIRGDELGTLIRLHRRMQACGGN